MDLAGITIAKARRMIRAGELSPVQLVDAVQAAIEKTDPSIVYVEKVFDQYEDRKYAIRSLFSKMCWLQKESIN